MKTILTKIGVAMALCLGLSATLAAQGPRGHGGKDAWREKMQSEKIAFFTTELELTSQEAQDFWPVYNECQAKKMESYSKIAEANKALREAVESKADGKTIIKLVEDKVKASEESQSIDRDFLPRFRKVLSDEKVGKLYLAEEKFRRQQINHLGGMQPGRGPRFGQGADGRQWQGRDGRRGDNNPDQTED